MYDSSDSKSKVVKDWQDHDKDEVVEKTKMKQAMRIPRGSIKVKEYNKAFYNLSFRSSFIDDINEALNPNGLKGPTVQLYDGTRDPNDNVSKFQWAIMDPNLWSLYFVGILDG